MYRCLHTKGYPRAIEIGHGFSVVGTAVPQGESVSYVIWIKKNPGWG
jgi:hypothetical protein